MKILCVGNSFAVDASTYVHQIAKAICEKHKRENGPEYRPQVILVSNGAKQNECNAIMSLVSSVAFYSTID